MPTPERATEGLAALMFGNTSSGAPPATATRHKPGVHEAPVMDDAAAVARPVERGHAAAERQLDRFPRHLQLLELLQEDAAAAACGFIANEREISAIRRNDRVNVAEIRGRTCQLPPLTILERVQIDRRRGTGGAPIAEDQVLAIRRPREPIRPAAETSSPRLPSPPRTAAARGRRAPASTIILRLSGRGHVRTRCVVRQATRRAHGRAPHRPSDAAESLPSIDRT